MSRMLPFVLVGLLSAALGGENLSAQSAPREGAEPAIRYGIATAGSREESAGREAGQATEYAGALDGSGLIAMDRTRMTRLIVGSTASVGWDTNPYNVTHAAASVVSILSPYVGFQSNTMRTQIIGQYQPTFAKYSSDAYSGQSVHLGSLLMRSNLSPRWEADSRIVASYGNDSARFVAPKQAVAVGSVPGTDPSSAAYLHNAGTGTNIQGSIGFHYKVSERSVLDFVAANAYSRFTGLGGENSVATGTVSFDHGLSPRLAVLVYGQGLSYYGTLESQGLGMGAGVKGQVNQSSFFSLRGGPQFNISSGKSQQGFSFNASLGTRLTGRSQIYVLAARQPTVSFLGGGLWQTSFSGGYQRELGTKGSLSFDTSHLTSDTTSTTGSYSGTYFNGVYGRRLAHGLSTSLTYRGFTGRSGGTDLTRNAVMFSIVWTPEAGHILQ